MRRLQHATFSFSVLSALALGLGACAGDDPGEQSELTTNGGNEAGDGDGDESTPINWVPARGISILEVEANQGTRVAITGEGGEWRGPSDRNMRLLSERDTLIRVHWTVADGWQPHEVKARLTLDTGAGEPIVREQILLVEGDSTRTALDRTFYFGLVAEEGETVPGTTIEVELFESDTEQDTALAEVVPVAPISGPELLGFEDDPMELKVMLVPIHYTGGGEDRLPNLSEEHITTLIDSLYEENPVQEVFYQVRDAVEYNQQMNNLGSLLPVMASVKQNDGADPNLYYHAMIDIGCPVVGCGGAGVAGIAQLAGDSKNGSLSRVAATVFYENASGQIDSTADTFVHEVGHNQGLNHVYCPGADAAGPDPSYPHENGKIGEWGFGIRSFTLHNPTASHDYMTYCGNTWGSDWTFAKTYQRIRTLTSWDYEGGAAEPEDEPGLLGEELVIGALYPDGTEEWFKLDGAIELEEILPGEALRFEIEGYELEQPAVVRTLSDDETQWVIAPLPEGVGLESVETVTHLRDNEVRRVLPASEVAVHLSGPTDITFQ